MTYLVGSGQENVTQKDFVVLVEDFKNEMWKRKITESLSITQIRN